MLRYRLAACIRDPPLCTTEQAQCPAGCGTVCPQASCIKLPCPCLTLPIHAFLHSCWQQTVPHGCRVLNSSQGDHCHPSNTAGSAQSVSRGMQATMATSMPLGAALKKKEKEEEEGEREGGGRDGGGGGEPSTPGAGGR